MLTTPNRFLTLIVLFYLLLATATNSITPLGESPDELDHFLYMTHLVQTGQFPILKANAADNVTMEANQPPLYYLLGAALIRPIPLESSGALPLNACYSFEPTDNGRSTFYQHTSAEQFPYHGTVLAFHVARFFSTLLGVGTLLITYWLAGQIRPQAPTFALLAVALLAFNPQFIFMTASVNNDVPSAFLGVAIVALAVYALSRPSVVVFVGLGVLVGCGLLTKFALLALWPLALWPALLWLFTQRRLSRDWFVWVGLALLIPLLMAAPWYWRSHVLYGDPLAWDLHLSAKGAQVLRTTPFTLVDWRDFVRIHFESYWGWFGWLKIQLPTAVYLFLLLLTLLSLAGLLLRLRSARPSLSAFIRHPSSFLLLAVLAIYVSLFRYILTINWSGYQGRLAYAVVGPLAVLLALGLWHWLEQRPLVASALSAGFGLLPVASLLFLLMPAFSRPQIYQNVGFATAVCARFNDTLLLEAVRPFPNVASGQVVPVTLYSYGLTDGQGRGELTAVDGTGAPIAQNSIPLAWSQGQVLSWTLPLTLDNALPSRGLLQFQLFDAQNQPQPATSLNHRPLDLPLNLLSFKIPPALPVVAAPTVPLNVPFGPDLTLLGYDLTNNGRSLALTLTWQAAAPISQDLTTFAHLQDSQQTLLSQADSQPHDGLYPTSLWDVGEIVTDTKTLSLPDGATAVALQITVGVYHLQPDTGLLTPIGDPLTFPVPTP